MSEINTIRRISILPALLAGSFVQLSAGDQVQNSPNIIFVLLDDLGYGDLGCYGSTVNRTPTINKMAKEGIRFTDAYSASSVSTPSRAAIMTGKYPIRTGLTNVLFPTAKKGISPDETTMPEMLRQQGYSTGIVGKWHLGTQHKYLPLQQGFDYYLGIPYSNDMNPCVLMRNNQIVSDSLDQSELTRLYTREATDFIEQNRKRPFFLYLAHTMPHVPLFASAQFKGKSGNGIYGDVVEELDWSMEQIMKKIRELKLEENTLIIFTSDNGPWLKKGPEGGVSHPLFQGKFTTWEGGQRVPLIAYWKGKIKPSVNNSLITLMDWYPTFSTLSGYKLNKSHATDGIDLTPLLLKNKSISERSFFYFENEKIAAFRYGNYKLVLPRGPWKGNKFVPDVAAHDTLLFDLKSDIGEKINIFNSEKAAATEVISRFNTEKAKSESF